MRLEISHWGVQFLAPGSLCSPSYRGLKVHIARYTLHVITRYYTLLHAIARYYTYWDSELWSKEEEVLELINNNICNITVGASIASLPV